MGGGGTKADAAVQTVSSGEQPAMWQEVAAVGALHQVWSASASAPSKSKSSPLSGSLNAASVGNKGGAGERISFGGGGSFGRSGMKHSYNFSGTRK